MNFKELTMEDFLKLFPNLKVNNKTFVINNTFHEVVKPYFIISER